MILFAEYGAGRCFLSQSPWYESLGVCVFFTEPGLSLPTYCNSPAAVWCRQAPQSNLWTCGDGTHLCQSQYQSSYLCEADGVCEGVCELHMLPWPSVWVSICLGLCFPMHYVFYVTNPYLCLCPGRWERDTAVPLSGYFLTIFCLVKKNEKESAW